MNTKKIFFFNISFFSFFILLDQLSKYLIRTSGGFYICNPGIAWGLVIPKVILFGLLSAIVITLLFILIKHQESGTFNKKTDFSIILLLSGAISNIADRLYFGCVIDFIDLKFWPIFNLADIFISLGVIFLIVHVFKKNKN